MKDVQELLIAADFLISDYSSIITDFALLNKPILIYCPDLEDYLSDRGFNQDFNAFCLFQKHIQFLKL